MRHFIAQHGYRFLTAALLGIFLACDTNTVTAPSPPPVINTVYVHLHVPAEMPTKALQLTLTGIMPDSVTIPTEYQHLMTMQQDMLHLVVTGDIMSGIILTLHYPPRTTSPYVRATLNAAASPTYQLNPPDQYQLTVVETFRATHP